MSPTPTSSLGSIFGFTLAPHYEAAQPSLVLAYLPIHQYRLSVKGSGPGAVCDSPGPGRHLQGGAAVRKVAEKVFCTNAAPVAVSAAVSSWWVGREER